MDCGKDDARLKRFALQIVIMLPGESHDALRVLDYAKELLEWEHQQVADTVLRLIS